MLKGSRRKKVLSNHIVLEIESKTNIPFLILPTIVSINGHTYPKQKQFFNSYEYFLSASTNKASHPSPFWKIAKMAFFNPYIDFDFFFWPSATTQKLFWNFVQKVSQALSIRYSLYYVDLPSQPSCTQPFFLTTSCRLKGI